MCCRAILKIVTSLLWCADVRWQRWAGKLSKALDCVPSSVVNVQSDAKRMSHRVSSAVSSVACTLRCHKKSLQGVSRNTIVYCNFDCLKQSDLSPSLKWTVVRMHPLQL